MPSLAEQLRPLLEDWARVVAADAAQEMVFTAKANCPVAPIGGGEMLASIEAVPLGDRLYELRCEDRGFTDEGPEPHRIDGNPLLAFDWPEAPPGYGGRLFPAIFAHVNWVPGAGVAANKGWFSQRSATDENWGAALLTAAERWDLGSR